MLISLFTKLTIITEFQALLGGNKLIVPESHIVLADNLLWKFKVLNEMAGALCFETSSSKGF